MKNYNYPVSKIVVFPGNKDSDVLSSRLENEVIFESKLNTINDKSEVVLELKNSIYKYMNKTLDETNIQHVEYKDLSKKIFESRNDEKFNLLYIHSDNSTTLNELCFNAISQNVEYKSKVNYLKIYKPEEKLLKLLKLKNLPASVFIYHNKIDDEGFKIKQINNSTFINLKRAVEEVSSLLILVCFR